MVAVKEIELEGHIIDSLVLPKAFDVIMDAGGDFDVLEFQIGKHKSDISHARILIKADSREQLDYILSELLKIGAKIPEVVEVKLRLAPKNRTLPEGFYSTTNHPTYVLISGEWVGVENIEMDVAIVVDTENKGALGKPISDIKKGDLVVVGNRGIRVEPPERPRSYSMFEFMKSSVSSEKPVEILIKNIAETIKDVKREGKKILVVAGPAVVHTSAAKALASLIKAGYVDVFFAGNAVAVHDIESQLFGTSLGINLKTGKQEEGGHRHHLYAINEVMQAGSIENLVRQGKLRAGIMNEIIKNNIPFVLAGSIRDDGPLPEVITDVIEAQKAMRIKLEGVGLVLMLSSMLHSIAVGNILPSWVKTICVDINPATVTKLTDRGTAQALGVVTDVGTFLPALRKEILG